MAVVDEKVVRTTMILFKSKWVFIKSEFDIFGYSCVP